MCDDQIEIDVIGKEDVLAPSSWVSHMTFADVQIAQQEPDLVTGTCQMRREPLGDVVRDAQVISLLLCPRREHAGSYRYTQRR